MFSVTSPEGSITQTVRGGWRLFTRDSDIGGADSALVGKFFYAGRVLIINHAVVSTLHQAAHHVGAHSSKANYSELHFNPLF